MLVHLLFCRAVKFELIFVPFYLLMELKFGKSIEIWIKLELNLSFLSTYLGYNLTAQ